MIATFTTAFFEERHTDGTDTDFPVFIIGMPQSGTTLVAQILCGHPQIFGAVELKNFNQATVDLPEILNVSMPYPQCNRQTGVEYGLPAAT